MISCDRCKKDIGEPLDSRTYTVTCEERTPGHHANSLPRVMQLCDECVKVLRTAIARAISECLKGQKTTEEELET